jgi:hypothetical protein
MGWPLTLGEGVILKKEVVEEALPTDSSEV